MSDIPPEYQAEIRLDYPVPIQQVPHLSALVLVPVSVPVAGPDGQPMMKHEERPMIVAYLPTGPFHLIVDWEEAEAFHTHLGRFLDAHRTGLALPPPQASSIIVPRNGQPS